MKMLKYKNQIFLSLGVIVFCVVVWYMINKAVDNRVANIEVRVPTIKLPKQEIIIKYEGFGQSNGLPKLSNGLPKLSNCSSKISGHASEKPSIIKQEFPNFSHIRSEQARSNYPREIPLTKYDGVTEGFENSCETQETVPLNIQSASGHPERVIVDKVPGVGSVMDAQAKVGTGGFKCQSDADCNVVYNGNVCKVDGTCQCNKGSGKFCHLGPTNYKELKDMTSEEKAEFKSKYWNNMTIRDYLNWLSLYESDPHNLEERHRKNLNKIEKGGKVTVDDIPKYRSDPPMNAGDYYSSMWCKGNVAIRFPITSETGPFLPSNADDYSEFIPPSEGIGRPILANQGEKSDAYALDYLIRPRVTTGSERTEIGRRYRQRQKERRDKESMFKDEPWVFHKLDDPEYNLPDEILDKVYYKNFT